MASTDADTALLRNLALLRLLAYGLEDDIATTQTTVYALDTNVAHFLSDPVGNAYLVQIFGGRLALKIPAVVSLARTEDKLLRAFASYEADRIASVFRKFRTHIFRPHLLEVSWLRARLQGIIERKLTAPDEDIERELALVTNLERQLVSLSERTTRNDDHNTYETFTIFLQNFENSVVHEVDAINRLNKCIKESLFTDNAALRWERRTIADPELWHFFNDALLQTRASMDRNPPKDVKLKVMQDAEVLSLVCQLNLEGPSRVVLLSFDWAIIRMMHRLYHDNEGAVPYALRQKLPGFNFIRHPIVYTSFCSGHSRVDGAPLLRSFIRDLDFVFGNIYSHAQRKYLAEISILRVPHDTDRLPENVSHKLAVSKSISEAVANDLLFVHEESAVRAVAEIYTKQNSSLNTGQYQLIVAEVKKQIAERSVEKATALIKTFASVPLIHDDADSDIEDEARVILKEWSTEEIPAGKRKQLLRNMPGWVRIDKRMKDILEEISDNSDAYVNTLQHIPRELDNRFYLLGALIAAIKGDWKLSERYALVARDLSAVSDDQTKTLIESEYWLAVSRRHVVNPGAALLASASRRLRRAISLTERSISCTEYTDQIDIIRFQSEAEALNISAYCHTYVYGNSYAEFQKSTKSAPLIFESLQSLIERFEALVHVPYDALAFRLAVQLFSNVSFLALCSLGLPPRIGADNPVSNGLARRYLDSLRRVCGRRGSTVSIPTQATLLLGEIVVDGRRSQISEVRALALSDENILSQFDKTLLLDAISWIETQTS